jgi:hypothetical protein
LYYYSCFFAIIFSYQAFDFLSKHQNWSSLRQNLPPPAKKTDIILSEKEEFYHMLKSTEEFVCFLNQNNLKYCLDSINANDNEQITMCITSETLSDITIHFLFDSNNQIVYIRIWNLLKIPDQFNSIALTIINELNNTYRFVRFYLNTDNGIDVFVDSLIHSGTIGKTCINLGIVIAKICDSIYPKLTEYFQTQQM